MSESNLSLLSQINFVAQRVDAGSRLEFSSFVLNVKEVLTQQATQRKVAFFCYT